MWKLLRKATPRHSARTFNCQNKGSSRGFATLRPQLLPQYPPTYFTNSPNSPPVSPSTPTTSASIPPTMPQYQQKSKKFDKDFVLCVVVLILSYLAVDNYITRVQLEKESFKKIMEYQKASSMAQMTFNNARKKREMQILNERRNFQRREMKMAIHIALLRKQLEQAGIDPIDINAAIAEFEKHVKMENSISNITGTSLWVVDDSDLKSHVPSSHDYGK